MTQALPPTEKLYEASPELAFDATVLACEAQGEGFRTVLNRTAFFPEGGGQASDVGTLGGLTMRHAEVHGDVVYHLVDAALPIGTTVTGQVDAAHRLDQAQQHSGEHILSGIVNRLYGYDNVGFHIGTEHVTLDFSGELSAAQCGEAEREANALVFANVPIQTWYPPQEVLAALPYRSKRALAGAVRIVQIPGGDTCACCGTHVQRTGEIGLIKITHSQRYKGGSRLYIHCGGRALSDYGARLEGLRATSQLLSSAVEEVPGAVAHLLQERDAWKARHAALAEALLDTLIKDAPQNAPSHALFLADMPDAQVKKGCALLADKARIAALFIRQEAGWRFAIGTNGGDVRPLAQALCAAFGGRGGGKPAFAQGSIALGDENAVRAFIAQWASEHA